MSPTGSSGGAINTRFSKRRSPAVKRTLPMNNNNNNAALSKEEEEEASDEDNDARLARIKAEAREYALRSDDNTNNTTYNSDDAEYTEFCKHLQQVGNLDDLLNDDGDWNSSSSNKEEEEDFVLPTRQDGDGDEDLDDDDDDADCDLDPLLFSPNPSLLQAENNDDPSNHPLEYSAASPSMMMMMDSMEGGNYNNNLWYQELAEELEQLQTEDMEAAVASLIDNPHHHHHHHHHHPGGGGPPNQKHMHVAPPSSHDSASSLAAKRAVAASKNYSAVPNSTGDTNDEWSRGSFGSKQLQQKVDGDNLNNATPSSSSSLEIPPSTPLRDAARGSLVVTEDQYSHLQRLVRQHYQVLIQQTVLCVRAVHSQKTHQPRTPETCLLESPDDLVEIMDAAVNMLQDLRNNQVDAVRQDLLIKRDNNNSITEDDDDDDEGTGNEENRDTAVSSSSARRSLFAGDNSNTSMSVSDSNKRLTRAQFKSLAAEYTAKAGGTEGFCQSIFNVAGLERLPCTFNAIEKNVRDIMDRSRTSMLGSIATEAGCQNLLQEAGAEIDEDTLPGRDASTAFCNVQEFLGPDFKPPSSMQEQVALRKNRNLFTSAEDNLVLRGVNLYGEKQWLLISERYLPDRSVNVISQRYNKLCMMIYKANGIYISEDGGLREPTKMDSVDDLDEAELADIQKVPPPAVLNVHRWSMEEDLTLLRTVPLMGNMWAELGARFIPHRDRGHLRKRYQVLQRRVKATVTRANRQDFLRIPKWPASPPPKASPYETANGPFSRQSPSKSPSRGDGLNPFAPASSNVLEAMATSQADTAAAAILAGARNPTPKKRARAPVSSYPTEQPRKDNQEGADKMLEQDESEVANAMNQLAKSPAKPPRPARGCDTVEISNMELGDEPSGLSMFATTFSPAKKPRREQSLMAGVMARNKRNSSETKTSMEPPPPQTPSKTDDEIPTGNTPVSFASPPIDSLTWKAPEASPTLGSISIASFPAGDSRMLNNSPPGISMDGYNYSNIFGKEGSPEGSTMGDEALETEAISALSRLSNSPAVRPEKRKHEGSSSSATAGSRKKSLFATVVGEKKQPEK